MPERAARAVHIRADTAEALQLGPTSSVELLADSSGTHGALSAIVSRLAEGADGAVPHLHDTTSETFYVLDGSVDVLAGEAILTATTGDLVVVPPGTPHAFAASEGRTADLLVVVSPGIERFDYFRLLAAVADGDATREEVLATAHRYDTRFEASKRWEQRHAPVPDTEHRPRG
jgi:quercetin dioxygenase-like cupin family protein